MSAKDVHKALISDRQPSKTKNHIGRNKNMLHRRNVLLYHRYYYYVKIHKLKYELTMSLLSGEFLLATNTIERVIISGQSKMKEMFSTTISVSQLGKKYHHIKWHNKLSAGETTAMLECLQKEN